MSGNDDFNQVPSWYTPPAPPAPPAPTVPGPPGPGGQPSYDPYAAGQAPAGQFAHQSSMSPKKSVSPVAAKMGIKAVLVVGVLGWGAISALGTTSAEDLAVGDCFVMSEATEIDRLETPDCSEAHDGQIIGTTSLNTVSYPTDDFDPVWEEVFEDCVSIATTAVTRVEALPPDTAIDMFTPTSAAFDEGDREVFCVIFAPSGLDGTHMAIAS